jgi:hypothetical protein
MASGNCDGDSDRLRCGLEVAVGGRQRTKLASWTSRAALIWAAETVECTAGRVHVSAFLLQLLGSASLLMPHGCAGSEGKVQLTD